jgi:hypothetical protein
MRHYRRVLNILHRLSNLLTSIRKVEQQMHMKEAVTAVAPQRRELVGVYNVSSIFDAHYALGVQCLH